MNEIKKETTESAITSLERLLNSTNNTPIVKKEEISTEKKTDQPPIENNNTMGVSGIIESIVATVIVLVLSFIYRKVIEEYFTKYLANPFIKYLVDPFKLSTIKPRHILFEYQQRKLNLPVSVRGDTQLFAKTLFGDVSPPHTYGVYTLNPKSPSNSRIEMNTRVKGKDFKKLARYLVTSQ